MIEKYINKQIAENRQWILERELNANLLEDKP
jgi:hypothetical protein